MVNLGRSHPGITSFDTEGAASIVDHLVTDHGRRRFVFVGGWDGNADQEERKQAFLEALVRHGLEPAEGGVLCGFFVYEGARAAFGAWLDGGGLPDAVVAANDRMAFACHDELVARGVAVPAQVSLTGFDDFPRLVLKSYPGVFLQIGTPLTTNAVLHGFQNLR